HPPPRERAGRSRPAAGRRHPGDRSCGEARRHRHHPGGGVDRHGAGSAGGGVAGMSAVAAKTDRRFRRVHVKPGRKRRWRAIVKPLLLWSAAAAALAYGAYRTSVIVADAHVLVVDRIIVRGNERLSDGDVLVVLSGLRGESLVWTDLDLWRRRLMAS